MSEKLTVPAWAKTIRVERRRSQLVVFGEGRIEEPVMFSSDLNPSSQDLFGQYVPLIKVGEKRSALPPHVQFARAHGVEDQVAFVKAFGPILGVLKRKKPHLVVVQDLATLQQQQGIFALAAKMVGEIQAQRDAKGKKERAASQERLWNLNFDVMNEIDPPAPTAPQMAMLDTILKRAGIPCTYEEALDRYMEDKPDPDRIWPRVDRYATLYTAHWMLDELLNRFPSQVTFFAGQPAELPPHQPEGILPMLYFMLRRDYLSAGRRLSTCPFEGCGRLFPVTRAGQKYCCEQHSYWQRGREYWRSVGSKRRRKLRKEAFVPHNA